MAKLEMGGQFWGKGERKAAAQLLKLPEEWVIISNRRFEKGFIGIEIDFIVVGIRKIFVIEEKSWSGRITGNRHYIPEVDRPNPFRDVDKKATMVAGKISEIFTSLKPPKKEDRFTIPRVLFTSPNLDNQVQDPLALEMELRLDTCNERLKELDERKGSKDDIFLKHRISIIDYLKESLPRQGFPTEMRGYRIVKELTSDQEPIRCFEALNNVTKDDRLLQVMEIPLTDEIIQESELALYTKYQTLDKLRETNRALVSDAPFKWEDKNFLVLPLHKMLGLSLKSSRENQIPSISETVKVFEDAYLALSEIHQLNVIHGNLSPETIFLDKKGKIRFSEFGEPRGVNEDLYSLTSALYYWLTGESIPKDDIASHINMHRPDICKVQTESLETIFREGINPHESGIGTASALVESVKFETRFFEKDFFRIQNEFLCCPKDVESKCCELCHGIKEPVGDHPFPDRDIARYEPTTEFLGEKYSGIIYVAWRPGTPNKNTKGKVEKLRIEIISYLKKPSFRNAIKLNDVSSDMMDFFRDQPNEFNFLRMGLKDRSTFAFMNLFKCRTRKGTLPDEPDILSHCIKHYFTRQMTLLRPKLVIYGYKSLLELVGRIKINGSPLDPGFGGVTDWVRLYPNSDLEKENIGESYQRIEEKVKEVLIHAEDFRRNIIVKDTASVP